VPAHWQGCRRGNRDVNSYGHHRIPTQKFEKILDGSACQDEQPQMVEGERLVYEKGIVGGSEESWSCVNMVISISKEREWSEKAKDMTTVVESTPSSYFSYVSHQTTPCGGPSLASPRPHRPEPEREKRDGSPLGQVLPLDTLEKTSLRAPECWDRTPRVKTSVNGRRSMSVKVNTNNEEECNGSMMGRERGGDLNTTERRSPRSVNFGRVRALQTGYGGQPAMKNHSGPGGKHAPRWWTRIPMMCNAPWRSPGITPSQYNVGERRPARAKPGAAREPRRHKPESGGEDGSSIHSHPMVPRLMGAVHGSRIRNRAAICPNSSMRAMARFSRAPDQHLGDMVKMKVFFMDSKIPGRGKRL